MEFFISHSVRGASGFLTLIGRCGDQPIPAGAEFRAIFREKPRPYPDGLEAPREIEDCRRLYIKIQEVEAFQRKVDFLPAHTTGVLRAVDSNIDLVPGGWILTDQCVPGNP